MSPALERPTETKVSIALPCAVKGGGVGCVSGRKDHQVPSGSSVEPVVARQRSASAASVDGKKRMAVRVEGSSGATVVETAERFRRDVWNRFELGLRIGRESGGCAACATLTQCDRARGS